MPMTRIIFATAAVMLSATMAHAGDCRVTSFPGQPLTWHCDEPVQDRGAPSADWKRLLPGPADHYGPDFDAINHRRFCGEGEFQVPRFVECVLKTGYTGPFGIEVLSQELREKPLEELTTRAFSTTVAQFRK